MKDENIEQIKQKLAFMNINKIVSIDNEWIQDDNIDLSRDVTDFIEEIHPQGEKELLRRISNEGYVTLQDVYDAKDTELIKVIDSKRRQQNQLPPNLKKLDDVLNALQEKGIVIEKISKYKSDIFKKYSNENCLFILDKEMDENDNRDIIKESIPNIIEEADRNGVNHLIITYSSNIGDEYASNLNKMNYVEQRIEHANKSNFYIYKMFAIEKKAETELDKELNLKISDCIYGDALYHYMVLEKEKADETYNSICEIENEEIARISNENIIEGNNIKDSIDIVKKALTKIKGNEKAQEERMILEKFNFYQKNKINNFILENSVLNSTNQYGKYREKQDIEFVDNILKSDIAIWENIDYSVNRLYKDISTGDIFKVKLLQNEEDKYFLIVENACNCVLRNQKNVSDISRRDRNRNIKVLLLEKGEISKIKKDELVRLFNTGEIIFPVMEDGICYLKNTGKVLSISQILLDLCTLNVEGRCLVNYEKDIIQKYKNYYFEKYMDMPQTMEEIENLKKYLSIENSIMEKALELEAKNKNIISPFQVEKVSKENLSIQRIGRLDYNITLRVCQKNYYKTEDAVFSGFDNQEVFDDLKEQRKTTNASTEKMVGIKKKK